MPTELEYAMYLKARYEDAKKDFDNLAIPENLLKLQYKNLNYDKLKIEVEKLGYHIELAKNIKIPFWQKQWRINPIFVFYKDIKDL